MGHQVNFFLTPDDVVFLERKLRALGELYVLRDRTSTSAPRIVETMNHVEDGKRWLYLYLAQRALLEQVVTTYVPAQGYWTVDSSQSPVIELSSCFFDGQILREGRLYYVDGFYGADGEWQDKPDVFLKWARSVLSSTRRSLSKLDGYRYAGPDAERWHATAGRRFMT